MKYWILICALLICSFLSASVYVWDTENGSYHFPDPETGLPSSSLTIFLDVLDELSVSYVCSSSLPDDLSQYDCTFAFLGSWCET